VGELGGKKVDRRLQSEKTGDVYNRMQPLGLGGLRDEVLSVHGFLASLGGNTWGGYVERSNLRSRGLMCRA